MAYPEIIRRSLQILLLFPLILCGCDRNTDSVSNRQTVTGNEHSAIAPGHSQATSPNSPASYVGAKKCAGCHSAEYQNWQGSHHDLAMQPATEESVLGNFGDVNFDYYGSDSTFYKEKGRFLVKTEGPDGKLQPYPIAYTFGVYPLQQYLVEFPGGRLQALSLAWDSRDKSEGGQRWFHLYPDTQIEAGDELHWTGINHNWNYMCADCHSTNLRKNYDLVSQSYDTQWSEINVACEACHGPGSRHLDWAQNPNAERENSERKGFPVSFAERKKAPWIMNRETGIARLEKPADTPKEISTCAQCHSRRGTSFPGARAGDAFLDHFNPALLEEPLYHADGQINGEVYVYGSFLQSKMFAAGVTCSNCHEPHSLELRMEGNGLCAQCHLPEKFDNPDHHFHPAVSTGAQCVNCHMPAKTYMQVDARRDHSFRIPRPDLSDKLETPNACTGCHTDKPDTWAAGELKRRFGKPAGKHYGEAIHAGRRGLPGAEAKLAELIADDSQPAIARATAVNLLPRYLSNQSVPLLHAVAQGDNPLLNLGLAQSLESVPTQIRPALAIPLLYEGQRVTEALAASSMADLPTGQYPEEVQQRLSRARNNYLASEKFNADRPESLINLADLHTQRGDYQQAEAFYHRALSIAPKFGPTYINLADLYRRNGREKEAEALLRTGLTQIHDKAPLEHSLGLSLVRQQRTAEALEHLRRASESENASSRYLYVYAIALNSTGKPGAALEILEPAVQRFPQSTQIIQALISIHREEGNARQSRQYEQLLHSSHR